MSCAPPVGILSAKPKTLPAELVFIQALKLTLPVKELAGKRLKKYLPSKISTKKIFVPYSKFS
ncbi:hypothetical protein COU00_00280 [Candidatus Falkowbacteria bacterium CG10_big_fil_rev_8_21_14_0_10_43_11]|uniref:Uncharacterized protein n=1 Tax=Candidatus Falkowbacteria bacterium CG10_big_fil_rev_8_21_14_0_10_43_11 TaxID=1974568 RepID=A0A2M6WN15_9BACT|nr:MAG: hypothetical protein COU00_00280 [Candidatus Falkowbacteria bacterium CG10_big_fil_rev_8_21_14_0_10_43_11]